MRLKPQFMPPNFRIDSAERQDHDMSIQKAGGPVVAVGEQLRNAKSCERIIP